LEGLDWSVAVVTPPFPVVAMMTCGDVYTRLTTTLPQLHYQDWQSKQKSKDVKQIKFDGSMEDQGEILE